MTNCEQESAERRTYHVSDLWLHPGIQHRPERESPMYHPRTTQHTGRPHFHGQNIGQRFSASAVSGHVQTTTASPPLPPKEWPRQPFPDGVCCPFELCVSNCGNTFSRCFLRMCRSLYQCFLKQEEKYGPLASVPVFIENLGKSRSLGGCQRQPLLFRLKGAIRSHSSLGALGRLFLCWLYTVSFVFFEKNFVARITWKSLPLHQNIPK